MQPSRSTHPFWMYEEMSATPDAIEHVLAADETERQHRAEIARRISQARTVYLTGCGTAYHAALVGEALLRTYSAGRIDARAVEAFELTHYAQPGPGAADALLVLSHSGRPTESNAALARARAAGAYCVTMTGDRESTAARNAQAVLDTGYSGVKSFAYTISYSLMLALLADLTAAVLTALPGQEGTATVLTNQLRAIPSMHREARRLEDNVHALAERHSSRERWVFAGAGGNYATALEAALKMQETNYTASVGMIVEEVLHGPIAALGEAVLVALAPEGPGRARALDVLRAARILGTETVAIGPRDDAELQAAADVYLPLPSVPETLSPLIYHVPVHMLSYWLAVARGTNPDLMRRDDQRYLTARQSYTL